MEINQFLDKIRELARYLLKEGYFVVWCNDDERRYPFYEDNNIIISTRITQQYIISVFDDMEAANKFKEKVGGWYE